MTPLPVSIAAAVASFLLLVVVFELIRSRRLRERYALLWLLTGVVLLALSLWRDGLNTIAGWFGVETYPPAILGAIGALFILVVLLHYSTVISRLSDQNTILAQRLALLEQQQREGDYGTVDRDRRADDVDVAELRVVQPVGRDADAVRPRPLGRVGRRTTVARVVPTSSMYRWQSSAALFRACRRSSTSAGALWRARRGRRPSSRPTGRGRHSR